MRRFKAYLKDQSGYVTLFVFLYLLIAFAGLLAEYFRIVDLREEAENILQRGINVAVEDMLRDDSRRDAESTFSESDVYNRFINYLKDEAKLDGSYRKMSPRDNAEIWRIELGLYDSTVDQDKSTIKFTMNGTIYTHSILSFLTGDIEFPFSVSSLVMRRGSGVVSSTR